MKKLLFKLSKFWYCIIIYFLGYGIIGAVLLGFSIYILGLDNFPEIIILPMFGSMCFSLYIFRKQNGSRWKSLILSHNIKLYKSFAYVMLFVMFMISVTLITPKEYSVTSVTGNENPYLYYLEVIIYFLFAAIGEEIMFRGIFFNVLKEKYNPWLVIIIISIMFGLGHADSFRHIISAFVSSMIFSIVYYRTNILSLCILMHFGGDFSSGLLINMLHINYYSVTIGIPLLLLSFFGFILMDVYTKEKIAIK